MFAVVDFGKSKSTGGMYVVAEKWLTSSKKCFWPGALYKSEAKINKAIQSQEDPDVRTWQCLPVEKVLFRCDDYATAWRKLNEAKYTSDLNSSGADKSAKKRNRQSKFSMENLRKSPPSSLPDFPVLELQDNHSISSLSGSEDEEGTEQYKEQRSAQRSEPRTERCSEPRTERRSEPLTERRSEPLTERRSEPLTERRSEPLTERRSEARTERRSNPQTERRSNPQTERRSNPQTERRSNPQTERRSNPQTERRSPEPSTDYSSQNDSDNSTDRDQLSRKRIHRRKTRQPSPVLNKPRDEPHERSSEPDFSDDDSDRDEPVRKKRTEHHHQKSQPSSVRLNGTSDTLRNTPGSSRGNSTPRAVPDNSSNEGTFQAEVLKILISIRNQVTHNTRIINGLVGRLNNDDGVDLPTDEEVEATIPLTSMAALARFERSIVESSEVKRKWVNYFGRIGGMDGQSTTKNIMKTMMSYDLAMSYNWCGRGEKEAFSKLQIVSLLIDSVHKNKYMENVSNRTITETLKTWLRFAPDRVAEEKSNRMRKRKD